MPTLLMTLITLWAQILRHYVEDSAHVRILQVAGQFFGQLLMIFRGVKNIG